MIGQNLGSYRIEAQIGSGAMGVVYRAVNEKTGRVAAVKVMAAEQSVKGTAKERFEREFEILQQFRHPHIVRCFAWGRAQGVRYLAMEFIAGTTVDAILEAAGGYLPWREVVDVGVQLCEALHYAHHRGVVHRDLKPSNLMVTSEGQLKLTDFGIAKDLDATALTGTGRTLGTAAYMAPEQIRGTPEVSHKTDLYALGCVLYEMLVGEPPFRGSAVAVLMNAHLNQDPPHPGDRNPEIPIVLDELIAGPVAGRSRVREVGPLSDGEGPLYLLAKAPSRRPWDAQAVAGVLTDLRDRAERGEPIPMVRSGPGHPIRAAAPEPSPSVGGVPLARPKRRRKVRAAPELEGRGRRLETLGLAAALVGLLALGYYLMRPPSVESVHRKAEALMASPEISDWNVAERDYFADLEQRTPPGHPYRAEVAAWRDRIVEEKARRRAALLGSRLAPEPRGEAEEIWVGALTSAAEATKANLDADAARLWHEARARLAELPDGRGWALLAARRAAELDAVVARRRKEALDLVARAALAQTTGNPALAASLRRALIRRFGAYPELSDLVEQARAALPADEPADPPAPEAARTPGSREPLAPRRSGD